MNLMSKLYDLLHSVIVKVKSIEKALPTKLSQLEIDVETGTKNYNALENKPTKLSQFENDLYYKKEYVLCDLTVDNIGDYPVCANLEGMDLRKISDETTIPYDELNMIFDNDKTVTSVESIVDGIFQAGRGCVLLVQDGANTNDVFGIDLLPGTYFMDVISAGELQNFKIFKDESKLIDDEFINPSRAYVFDKVELSENSAKIYQAWLDGRLLRYKDSDKYYDCIYATDSEYYITALFITGYNGNDVGSTVYLKNIEINKG